MGIDECLCIVTTKLKRCRLQSFHAIYIDKSSKMIIQQSKTFGGAFGFVYLNTQHTTVDCGLFHQRIANQFFKANNYKMFCFSLSFASVCRCFVFIQLFLDIFGGVCWQYCCRWFIVQTANEWTATKDLRTNTKTKNTDKFFFDRTLTMDFTIWCRYKCLQWLCIKTVLLQAAETAWNRKMQKSKMRNEEREREQNKQQKRK